MTPPDRAAGPVTRGSDPATDAGRQLRADARKNRARVLEAAETLFLDKGTSVSTEVIARAAGVGDLQRILHTLLTRAQQAGLVRKDIGVADVHALIAGAARATEHVGQDRQAQDRVVAVVLDGLRPASRRRPLTPRDPRSGSSTQHPHEVDL